MLDCINNSGILRISLEFVSTDDYEIVVKNEFENMCTRFGLNGIQMISLVTTLDISLLIDHYDTIWDGLNYYSMTCMDDYKTAYIESIYKTNLMDNRIENLCDDLKEYIKKNSCINIENKCNTFKNACKINHDTCVKYLLNNSQNHDIENDHINFMTTYKNMNTIDYICLCGGSLEVVKYAFEIQKKDCSYNVINYASENCHLSIIKYLFEIQKKDCTYYAIDRASSKGHLDVIRYLFETQKKDCSMKAIHNAICNGHLDIVKYLFEIQKKDCSIRAIYDASRGGHLNVVKYLFEIQKKKFDLNAIECARFYGHSDVVEYLSEITNGKYS